MTDPDDLIDLHNAAVAVQDALGVLVERLEVMLPEPELESASEPVPDAERFMAEVPAEPMKRLTIDIPESLHTRLKIVCAARHIGIADLLRDVIAAQVTTLEAP